MLLIRLKLENWRAVSSCEIVFGRGVNIVEGANEAGKSSFIEALNLLFRERDSSRKKEIRSVTPKGNDVGSAVTLEFKTGDYHLTYHKVFNRRAATSLLMHAPDIRQFTGQEAHEKVLAIMDSTIDFALWQALQLEQGDEFSVLNLRHSSGLSAALDNAAGGAGIEESDADLIDRVKSEYCRYYTERTGRETGQLAELRKVCEEMAAAEEGALNQLQSMQGQIEQSARLATTINEQQALMPELVQSLEAARKQQSAVAALRDRNQLLSAQVEGQQLKVDAGEQSLAERQASTRQINTLSESMQTIRDEITRTEQQLQTADEALRACLARRDEQQQARQTLQRTIAALDKELLQSVAMQELSTVKTRYEQYQQCNSELAALQPLRTAIRIDDCAVRTLEQLDEKRRTLEIKLATRRPALTVTALRDVTVDEQTVASGEMLSLDTSSTLAVTIGDSARLQFTPATDLEGLQGELDAVLGQLRDQYAHHGVDSLTGARDLLRRGYELDQRIESLSQRIDAAAGGDVNALIARREHLHRLHSDGVAGRDSAVVREALADHNAQLTALENTLASLNIEGEESQGGRAVLKARVAMLNERLAAEQREHERVVAHMNAATSRLSDEQLHAALVEQQKLLVQYQTQLHTVVADMETADAGAVGGVFDSARLALERARSQLHSDEKAFAAVSAQLDQLKTEGLHEKLQRIRADRADAQEQLANIVRAAVAARCLWTTLCRHQRDARLHYAKPLSERVRSMGRLVFGDGFDVQINESLAIEARTLNGATVPFSDLSGGAKEQLGILLRLAATQLVTGLPLILDDTLGHTDAARLETMGALLSAAGREAQIVVMTCYPQRYRFVGDAKVSRLQDSDADGTDTAAEQG